MKQWYLIAYDIHDPKRLRRFHYRLNKIALALQESVFLVQADKTGLDEIRAIVKDCTHTREDDVRLYPIASPGTLWSAGVQDRAFRDLHTRARKIQPSRFKRILGWLLGKNPS